MNKTINFENHRKNKLPVSNFISVILEDNTIKSGWTCGRDLDEINEDFGEQNVNWFYFQHKAEAYLIQHRNKK